MLSHSIFQHKKFSNLLNLTFNNFKMSNPHIDAERPTLRTFVLKKDLENYNIHVLSVCDKNGNV